MASQRRGKLEFNASNCVLEENNFAHGVVPGVQSITELGADSKREYIKELGSAAPIGITEEDTDFMVAKMVMLYSDAINFMASLAAGANLDTDSARQQIRNLRLSFTLTRRSHDEQNNGALLPSVVTQFDAFLSAPKESMDRSDSKPQTMEFSLYLMTEPD